MPIVLEATVEGEQQLARRLSRFDVELNDFSESFNEIRDELLHSFDENFGQRGGLFGGWAPRATDRPWPLLERTGEMREGFRGDVHRDYLVIDNPTPYFAFHQSNRPRTKIPRRVMMKIDDLRKTFIQKAIQKAILEAMNRSNQ